MQHRSRILPNSPSKLVNNFSCFSLNSVPSTNSNPSSNHTLNLSPGNPGNNAYSSHFIDSHSPEQTISVGSDGNSIQCKSKYKARNRKYFHLKHKIRKTIASTRILEEIGDNRLYAEVHIAGVPVKGLLDSGASITVLGRGSESFLENSAVRFYNQPTLLSTASGEHQRIVGHIRALVSYGNKQRTMSIFIAPGLTQHLYLGIDFWKLFGLAPKIVSDLSLNTPKFPPLPAHHDMSEKEICKLQSIIESFPSFAKEGLGKTNVITHIIDTGDAKPVKQRFYAVSPKIENELFQEVNRMLALGVIEECPNTCSWNNPVTMVSKANGKKRFCLDARILNGFTVKDAYGLPIIDGLLSRLSDTHFISAIDLKDAFWQIPLDPNSRDKTAFTVPGRPLYRFTVMPFGLCNAPQTMCRLMDKVIPHHLQDRIFVYLDDLLVISATLEEHFALLEEVASRLRKANLTINVEKSRFALTYTRYLGYVVGGGRLQVDTEKVEAVKSFPIPKTTRHVRRFLGMSGWYSRFIPNYASIATPLTDLLGNKKFQWTPKCQDAFNEIKDKLTTAPVLCHPDYNKTFFVQCDASKTGVGSVIFQKDDEGFDHPIAYFSKKLNRTQRNYSVTELECYAVVLSIKKFRQYLEGYEFVVITDHASLQWLMRQSNLSGRLARWSLKLQSFNMKIEHRKGKDNVVPDALSRTFSSEELLEVEEMSLEDDAFRSAAYMELVKKVENLKNRSNLIVKNGKVYIKVDNSLGNDSPIYRLYVPYELIPKLLNSNHDVPSAGHLGIEKTFERLSRLYYWPKMYETVREYVGNCHPCKSAKALNYSTRPPMGSFEIPELPFQRIYIDFLGPYPRSKAGFSYVMVVLDHLSKFLILEPIRSATANIAIWVLKKRVFNIFGVPEIVVSDNGSQFTATIFESFLSGLNIKHVFTPKYSPQSNASERTNRTVLAAVRAYLGQDHTNWDLHLDEIACAMRSAVHSSIGCSPYFAMFGRHMINDGESYTLLRELNCLGESDVEIVSRKTHLCKIKNDITEQLKIASQKHEHTYNLRSKKRSFEVGQIVYVRNFAQSDAFKKFNAKLSPKFLRAKIIEKIGNVAFRCEDEKGRNIGVYHLKDMHN